MQGAVLRPEKNRAATTNEPRRLSPDVDMRSEDGRRFADLYEVVALEFVGVDPLKVRDIALLKFAAERAVTAGAWEDVVRLHNLIARKESSLKAAMRAVRTAQPEGLRGRLAGRYNSRGSP